MCDEIGFVCFDDPHGWYEKTRATRNPSCVVFMVFQLEHCAETNVTCVRGFAQFNHWRPIAKWGVRLELGANAFLQKRPGASVHVARQCMTAGTDVDGRVWTVLRPAVTMGQIRVGEMERICIDMQRGMSLAEVAQRYPKKWGRFYKPIMIYDRVLNGAAKESDWLAWMPPGMERSMSDARAWYEFQSRQVDVGSFFANDDDDDDDEKKK